jgi:hypothetical protein
MQIKIAQRLFPFCHLPGTTCLIPGSDWQVQAFPTKLRFKSLISGEERELDLAVKGPVLDFTIQLNLEKLRVEIFGRAAGGYERYLISMEEKGIMILFEKEKRQELIPVLWQKGRTSHERLSLGSHKKLDWELVSRRLDLKEIFPVWLRLGQITPHVPGAKEGTASLLTECPKLELASHYTKLFLAGFKSLLVPRLDDDAYQGIIASQGSQGCPLILLTKGAELIRTLFFKEEGDLFHFLPCLSPEFHEGRFVDVTTLKGDVICFEWSKKTLAKVIIHPQQTREITCHLQHVLKSFRVKQSIREKGKRHLSQEPLLLEEGKVIYLDRFES